MESLHSIYNRLSYLSTAMHSIDHAYLQNTNIPYYFMELQKFERNTLPILYLNCIPSILRGSNIKCNKLILGTSDLMLLNFCNIESPILNSINNTNSTRLPINIYNNLTSYEYEYRNKYHKALGSCISLLKDLNNIYSNMYSHYLGSEDIAYTMHLVALMNIPANIWCNVDKLREYNYARLFIFIINVIFKNYIQVYLRVPYIHHIENVKAVHGYKLISNIYSTTSTINNIVQLSIGIKYGINKFKVYTPLPNYLPTYCSNVNYLGYDFFESNTFKELGNLLTNLINNPKFIMTCRAMYTYIPTSVSTLEEILEFDGAMYNIIKTYLSDIPDINSEQNFIIKNLEYKPYKELKTYLYLFIQFYFEDEYYMDKYFHNNKVDLLSYLLNSKQIYFRHYISYCIHHDIPYVFTNI